MISDEFNLRLCDFQSTLHQLLVIKFAISMHQRVFANREGYLRCLNLAAEVSKLVVTFVCLMLLSVLVNWTKFNLKLKCLIISKIEVNSRKFI